MVEGDLHAKIQAGAQGVVIFMANEETPRNNSFKHKQTTS